MSTYIAHDDPELSRRQCEHVVPVAADHFALGGHVTSGEFETRIVRQSVGEQAAFQQRGCGALHSESAALNRAGDTFCDHLEQSNIVIGEWSVLEPTDVKHTQ